MMRAALLVLIAGVALTGCTRGGTIALTEDRTETRWRAVTSEQDRERLRNWRKAWLTALPAARQADQGVIAAQGALFEHDRALPNALPPAGSYRCKIYKLGARRDGERQFATFPAAPCQISTNGELSHFIVDEGVQRPAGTIYTDTDARAIFLGALELGDEHSPPDYGQDLKRDMVGYIERVGSNRWRLVLPWPNFQSQLDVIEIAHD